MKILYIVSTLKTSGPNNVLYNIVKHFDKHDVNVEIVLLSKSPQENLESEFSNLGVKIHYLSLSRIQGLLSNYKGLDDVIEKVAPDIIHTHGIRGDLISSKKIKDIPTFTTMHNYPYHDYITRYGKIKGKVMALIHLRNLRNIDVPISCSYSIADLFKMNNINTKVVQNGIDSNYYKPVTSIESIKLREKLDLPKDKKIFISVGHLSKIKDPITLIKAFNKMKLTDCILLFLGDGELYNECKNEVNDSNLVRLIGRVSNVSEYLQTADYFISSSTTEGLPNSVLEAMSTGLPVCLTDIKPHMEIININKKSGTVFRPKSVKGVCKAIQDILKLNYEEASKAARSIITQELNAKKMSSKYLQLYREHLDEI